MSDLVRADHFDQVDRATWPWLNFSPREMADRVTGALIVSRGFMDRLQAIRWAFGGSLIVNSGYRTPAHNARVSRGKTGRTGPHTTGHAVDLRVWGGAYIKVFSLAEQLGMTGFGAHQKGPIGGRYLHLDDLPEGAWPRPTGWTY